MTLEECLINQIVKEKVQNGVASIMTGIYFCVSDLGVGRTLGLQKLAATLIIRAIFSQLRWD